MPMTQRRGDDADDQADLLVDAAWRRRDSRSSDPATCRRRWRPRCRRWRRRTARSARRRRRSSRAPTKIRQVRISVAIVMPEIGFDEVPIRPVMRDDTVDEEEAEDDDQDRRRGSCPASASSARRRGRSRAAASRRARTIIGMSRSVRSCAARRRRAPKSFRPSRADETIVGSVRPSVMRPGGEHRAGADVADVGAPQLARRHLEIRNGMPVAGLLAKFG